MAYWEETEKIRRRKVMESAANIFMMFCGFCGVYLMSAHMLYQEISIVSMLPYLAAGVTVALFLPSLAEWTAPEFLGKRRSRDGEAGAGTAGGKDGEERPGIRNGQDGGEERWESRDGDSDVPKRRGSRTGKNGVQAARENRRGSRSRTNDAEAAGGNGRRRGNRREVVYDRDTAVRRWMFLLACAACVIMFAWNFEDILRGCLVLADNIVFYFNYVFGTSCQYSVEWLSGKLVTTLGSGKAFYQLSDASINAIMLMPELGANCEALFGVIAFGSALLKTLYGCNWKTVLPDILFGGALIAAAFLVGAYKNSWTGMCLLIYLVSLMILFAQSGAETARRPEREKKRRKSIRKDLRKEKGTETKEKIRGGKKKTGTGEKVLEREEKTGTEEKIRGGKKKTGTGEKVLEREEKTGTEEKVRGGKKKTGTGEKVLEREEKNGTGEKIRGGKKEAGTGESVRGRKKRSTGETGRGRQPGSELKRSRFRKRKKDPEEQLRGRSSHILVVYNEKPASFVCALIFLVAIVLCVGVYLIQKSSYFDDYDDPWVVEKWEQAGDFVEGLKGGSGGISVDAEGGSTAADETETAVGEGTEDSEGETVISWEPAAGGGKGTAVTENLPSDKTVLGMLTLEDEMREASDTTYLQVLIDPTYYSSADTLYLKCYAGEIYEGDSWSAVTAEDIGVTDTTFNAMNASLVVATYDLFSQYIRGTASDYLKTTLPGLFDIGASGKIWIRYMGESSVLFVPYYAISALDDGEHGDGTLKSGDDTLTYAYNADELVPGIAGADAGTVIDYNAIAADFGDAFAYGDGLSISYSSAYTEYENEYLLREIYYDVPESLTRLREEFSEIEIGGETYDLNDYYPYWWNGLVNEVGLGDCIGYVINYLTANMTYSRSVAAVPEGADYIETFLLDRKTGYCSHYASAAVMMFRMMGIPARYAEGFAVDLDDAVLTTGGQYLVNVTGKSAHAWVEIYVSGVGWVPVNVTYGDDTTEEEETTEAETTGDRETSAAEMTTTLRTSEEESTTANGTGDGDADGQSLTAVFAKLSELFRSIGQVLGKVLRALKTPLLALILLELVRIFVRLARTAALRWKCRGKSEEEKLLIFAEDLNCYIDRHLHIARRHTMTQREVAEAEGDLFARADGKAGEERKTGWNPFQYHTSRPDNHGSGRKAGRRRSLADVIVRMGGRGGHALSAAEYEELLGLIRYAGKKTDAKERANLNLTMRKVKLVIYKESTWRRKVFF